MSVGVGWVVEASNKSRIHGSLDCSRDCVMTHQVEYDHEKVRDVQTPMVDFVPACMS